MVKIAFLFLTYDDLRAPRIWRRFFDSIDPSKYSIYCHPKNAERVTCPLLKKRIVDELVPTEWGSISLIRATYCLLRAAIEDPDNTHFVLLSDSCIPIYPFDRIFEELTGVSSPILSLFSSSDTNLLESHYGKGPYLRGSHWMMLNRDSISYLSLVEEDLELFDGIECPEELFFVINLQKMKVPILYQSMTFCNWNQPERDGKSPKSYEIVSANDILDARSADCLFFRKVTANAQIDEDFIFS